jgi:hypothetical protein
MLTLLAEIPIIYFSRKYFAPFFGLESPPGYAPLRATEADIEGLKSQLGLDLESKISPEKEVIIK